MCQRVSTAARHFFFDQGLLHDLRDFYTILRDFCAILHDFYTILHDFYAIFCQAQIFCCQAPETILHPCPLGWTKPSLRVLRGTARRAHLL